MPKLREAIALAYGCSVIDDVKYLRLSLLPVAEHQQTFTYAGKLSQAVPADKSLP